MILWNSINTNFTVSIEDINLKNGFEIALLKLLPRLPGAIELSTIDHSYNMALW